jgi:transcription elongation factor Elf1
MKTQKYYVCKHCNKQLLNQNLFQPCDNLNEFWCDDCGKTYIIEENRVIEEDAQ